MRPEVLTDAELLDDVRDTALAVTVTVLNVCLDVDAVFAVVDMNVREEVTKAVERITKGRDLDANEVMRNEVKGRLRGWRLGVARSVSKICSTLTKMSETSILSG